MTNDELDKLIERFEDKDDAISASEMHQMACGLIDRIRTLERDNKILQGIVDGKEEPFLYSQYCQQMSYEYRKEIEILESRASQFESTLKKTMKERNKLQDEYIRLKKIIAKEFNENDELGSEFVYVTILKDQIKVLNEKLKIATEALEEIKNKMPSCDCMDAPGLAREALEKIKGELK